MSTMTNEQAGCEWCGGHNILRSKNNRFRVVTSPRGSCMLECAESSNYDDIDFDYCPGCGRPFNLRPMTLEEAVAYGRPVWGEINVNGEAEYPKIEAGWILPDMPKQLTSYAWMRFWTHQPTPEQSAAWKWEEEPHHDQHPPGLVVPGAGRRKE